MRLLVARCEVSYTGRLTAFLPEAVRLLMIKSDGSVLVHADSGGYRPSNWMTPPTVIEEAESLIVVRKRAGQERGPAGDPHRRGPLATRSTRWTRWPALEKDGVEKHLQEALADRPDWLEDELRLDRREWMTEIGPVDLMCRDCDDGWVAVEIKRVGTIEAVEQLTPLPRLHPRRSGQGALPRHPRGAELQAAGGHARRVARDRLRRGRPRRAPRRARARADALRLGG